MHGNIDRMRKIRKLGSSKTGDVFGVTIPACFKDKFGDTFFKVISSGNNIILESGCRSE